MDITASLMTALTLLGLGMTFVFMFLGLLFICIHLMAKYIPADEPVAAAKKNRSATSNVAAQMEVSPQVVAAITSAIQQYRKRQNITDKELIKE